MVEVMHINSSLLRGLIDPGDKSDRRVESRHLLNASLGVQFRVSILAIGEFLGKMVEVRSTSAYTEAATELSRLFHGGRLDLFGIGREIEVFALAFETMALDRFLSPADAFLVASAMVDEECSAFATMDRPLLESIALKKLAASHGVKILDARKTKEKERTVLSYRSLNMTFGRGTRISSSV